MKKVIVLFFILMLIPFNVNGLSVSGRSTILMDLDSNRILYEKDINTKRLIASTTKIMTAILAIENGNLDEKVKVGEEVLKMYGSNIYIELNEEMSLRDLLYGLIMRSGNDAAVVIAVHIGGTIENFVKMMNDKASSIGMNNTTFENPTGLDDDNKNYSTALDMAKLSAYASKNPEYMKIASTKKYTVQTEKKSYLWNNRNKLLTSFSNSTSGKTGYTPSAGKTFVSTASNSNLNLTVITLNDGNIYQTAKDLYNYGFANYNNYLILDKNNFKVDEYYYKNKIYIDKSFTYPLTDEEKDQIKILVKLTKLNDFKDNDIVGKVIVYLNNNEIYNDNVYVKVNKESFWSKLWSIFK